MEETTAKLLPWKTSTGAVPTLILIPPHVPTLLCSVRQVRTYFKVSTSFVIHSELRNYCFITIYNALGSSGGDCACACGDVAGVRRCECFNILCQNCDACCSNCRQNDTPPSVDSPPVGLGGSFDPLPSNYTCNALPAARYPMTTACHPDSDE